MNTLNTTPSKPGLCRRAAGLAALSSLVMFTVAGQAQAQPGGPGMMGGPGGHSDQGMRHRHGGPRMGGADMEKFAERRIEYIIKEVGGTPEQKDKLLAIAKATAADMKPLREAHMQSRQKALGLLAAPTIDRAALEQLRAAEIQSADAMSKRMTQSMIDSAEVLRPEQRAKLAESMKKRMEGRQRP